MENSEQIKYKYTCKYCKKVYNEPIKECTACGSTDFIETTYLVKNRKKNVLMVFLLMIVLLCIFVVTVSVGTNIVKEKEQYESSDFTVKEYAYDESLLSNPKMYLGKNSDSSAANYNIIFKVTGKYHELCNNIYNNIYSSQLQQFNFVVPCNAEIKDDDLRVEITSLDFGYYGSNTAYVDIKGSFTGTTDKEITIYLVDENGNKDKMLIDDYYREKYSGVADYLCSDSYRKGFTVNNVQTEYKSLFIEYGDIPYEYELDYSRGTGYIEYYALEK